MRTSGPQTFNHWGVIVALIVVPILIGVVILFVSSGSHFPIGGIIGPLVVLWSQLWRQHDDGVSRRPTPAWERRPPPSPDVQARSHPLWDRWLDG
jgi:hypothetical protein